jgi:hypothetical protein
VTVIDHPARAAAARRGELAERMVSVAIELACLVRDEGPDEIGAFISALTGEERDALLIIQAALIPDDTDVKTLLSWVTWDEYGRPLPGAAPAAGRERVLAPPPARRGPRRLPEGEVVPCPSHAAFNRHKLRGELIDDGCAAAEKAYQDAYYALRRQRAAEKKAAAAAEAAPIPEAA